MDTAKYQRVLRLRREGLTFAQIGKKLGLTRQRVWQIFKRARSREREIKAAMSVKKGAN